MAYSVKIDAFEGPLDLLLHLIAKSKIGIENVSITTITEQYLGYLYQVQQFDMEIASEFLVMASTLIYIKSRKLLPIVPQEEDEEEFDSEKALIERLRAYQLFKEAAVRLSENEERCEGIHCKLPEEIFLEREPIEINGDIQLIFKAFLEAVKKKPFIENKQLPHTVKKDKITLKQRLDQIINFMAYREKCMFFDLFEGAYYKEDIVITFLAVLELVSEGILSIKQEENFGSIAIVRS